jgi:hypothetical protein
MYEAVYTAYGVMLKASLTGNVDLHRLSYAPMYLILPCPPSLRFHPPPKGDDDTANHVPPANPPGYLEVSTLLATPPPPDLDLVADLYNLCSKTSVPSSSGMP